MRIIYLSVFALMLVTAAHAQFINNGATVVIQSGATLKVETSFINTAGTVTNNGTLEVTGNFQNDATFTSGSSSLVKFNGNAGSTAKTNGAVLNDVEMAKASANVTLTDAMTINGNLSFTGTESKIVLGTNNLTMPNTDPLESMVSGAGANGYVVTNSTGAFIKAIDANGTKNMEVGDMSSYSPVSNVVTGSGYTSATISARVVDDTHPSKPVEADSYISRYWVINANGIANYNNTMTGTYAATGDANGTPSRIKGASFDGSDWAFTNAATNVIPREVIGSTSISSVDFTGMNALNKLNLTAFLFGAMPNVGTTMNNFLQVYDPPFTPTLLPTTSPYGAPTTTYADIANAGGVAGNVVDWIKVEIRRTSDPAVIEETRSLLLKTNGSIVDANGNIPYFKDHDNPVRVALHHRNHISVLSNSLSGVFEGKNESYNFSTAITQAPAEFGAPDQLRLKNGVYCLISGDMNGDFSADANDVPVFFTSFNNNDFDVYAIPDMNMDGSVDANDVPLFYYSFNLNVYSNILNF